MVEDSIYQFLLEDRILINLSRGMTAIASIVILIIYSFTCNTINAPSSGTCKYAMPGCGQPMLNLANNPLASTSLIA
jgi:hypothetical protein